MTKKYDIIKLHELLIVFMNGFLKTYQINLMDEYYDDNVAYDLLSFCAYLLQ